MTDKEYDSAILFQLRPRIVSTTVDEEDEVRPAVKPVRLSCPDGWRQRIGGCVRRWESSCWVATVGLTDVKSQIAIDEEDEEAWL